MDGSDLHAVAVGGECRGGSAVVEAGGASRAVRGPAAVREQGGPGGVGAEPAEDQLAPSGAGRGLCGARLVGIDGGLTGHLADKWLLAVHAIRDRRHLSAEAAERVPTHTP